MTNGKGRGLSTQAGPTNSATGEPVLDAPTVRLGPRSSRGSTPSPGLGEPRANGDGRVPRTTESASELEIGEPDRTDTNPRPSDGEEDFLSDLPTSTNDSHAPRDSKPERQALTAGQMVGHYEVIRSLGQGGMGQVLLARDTRLGRLVALKFLLHVDPERSARFRVEARATAQIAHENIVALHDIAEHDGAPYMVLEYVKGKTLAEWLGERARPRTGDSGHRMGLVPRRAAELMLPVVRALIGAHDAGIVHRDLKPSNIMLTEGGVVKVLDFGVAKLLDQSTDAAELGRSDAPPRRPLPTGVEDSVHDPVASVTRQGARIGTIAYMSPEQWGVDKVDARSDLWAVGMILYEMVMGTHPLVPSGVAGIGTVPLLDVPMPSLRELRPELGKLASTIDRCLIKRKADRMSSARELLAELEAVARPNQVSELGESETINPYAGLSAFEEQDAARFFGREREVEQVVARLASHALLAVVGPSGIGKSSLIRAGVIPALRGSGDAWEAYVIRPGPRPLAALAELLSRHSWRSSSGANAPTVREASASGESRTHGSSQDDLGALCTRLREQPGFLGVEMRARARRRLVHIVLFVDQFEEVYTLASREEREAFLHCLSGAADDLSSPLRIVVSMRHDFLDRVGRDHDGFADLISRGTVLIGPLDRACLRSALVKPAEALDHRFESDALVEEMLDAIERTSGALPLLQFTAALLWEARDRKLRMLTDASYRSFGGIGGALAGHADHVLGQMTSAERKWTRVVLLRLVTPERTRTIISRDELEGLGGESRSDVARVLDRLIDARLLSSQGTDDEERMVELVHESLITEWPALKRWLDDAQDDALFRTRLRNAAREWESSRCTEGLLWRGEAADEAQRWRARNGDGASAVLDPREKRYLEAVVRLNERSRRLRRRLVTGVIAGLTVIAVLVSYLSIQSRRQAARADMEAELARKQRAESDRSAMQARNASRLAAARANLADATSVLALMRESEPEQIHSSWSDLARWALDQGVATTVLPHERAVWYATFSPDGSRIVTASEDAVVRIWNADGRGEPLLLRGFELPPIGVEFSPDGKRIVGGSLDSTARVWNADGTATPIVLRGHLAPVFSAVFSPDGTRILTGSWDGTARIWNADGSGQPIVLRGHNKEVHSAMFSPDGTHVITASTDETARIWRADGKGEPIILRGHDDLVAYAMFSPDGAHVVTASADKTVRIWNADGKGTPVVLRGHDDRVSRAIYSPDGKHIVTASYDKSVKIWNADGSGQPDLLTRGTHWFGTAVYSKDGTRIVTASWDKTVRVWKVRDPRRPLTFHGHEGVINALTYSPDGARLASAGWDKTARVWSADGSGEPIVLKHPVPVNSVHFSPDGRRLVTAAADDQVRIWDLNSLEIALVLRGHSAELISAMFSPDGRRVVSGSRDMTARVWNADGSGTPVVLRGHEAQINTASFSVEGDRIVTSSDDKTVRVWKADGSGDAIVLRGHESVVYGAAFNPEGTRVVSTSRDTTVRVWNAGGSGDPLILRGHEGTATIRSFMPFSPDGKRFVTSSDDRSARIWNIDGSGQPIVLRYEDAGIMAAAMSPDGAHVAAASNRGLIVIWSDLRPIEHPDDARLWDATNYCMPIAVRKRLLVVGDDRAQLDLERCRRRISGTLEVGAPPPVTTLDR